MWSKITLTLAVMLVGGSPVFAQDWARKMFQTTSHDFGAVARGSKQQFAFEFTNIFKEEIHVASVRSSCGCTTARVTKDRLKTGERSAVIAEYNTRSFLGAKAATVTVVIDEPYYAEVQLEVSGYIRRDIVFTPGEVSLGSVDAGEGAVQKLEIDYAGRDDWAIVDIRSANRFFEVELDETKRAGGRVHYVMTVRLKPGAPAGFLNDQLTVVTNDTAVEKVVLPVHGNVVSPLTVSPAQLSLGRLKPGETVTKRLVVRAKSAFRIIGVDCDECFDVEADSASEKTLHFVPVTFTAGNEPGEVVKKIAIVTDLGPGLSADCVATATIEKK